MSVDLSLVPPTVGPRFPRHDGSAAGSDDDFIILPDPSIGEPLSAGTNRTLRGYHAATQAQRSNRVALLFLGLIFGGLFGFIVVKTGLPEVFQLVELELDPDLLTLMAFASMAFAGIVCAVVGFLLPLAFRKPLVTYVGQNGLMRYVKSRFGGPKTELLCFPDADELKVSRVRNHQNGVVRFRAGGDWIGVGDGFIEIGWKGAVERLDKAAIQSLSLAQGMLTIKRQGAKEGIFRSEGVFRFPVSAMSDFRTFLVALEVCTGYRFD
jgi:hypothetical protein